MKLCPLYSFDCCQAHLYCLMISSGLEQNGEENEGIKGFLVKDFVKEFRRGARLKCNFCKQNYSTVGCVVKRCKKSYHLPCGIAKGSLNQFLGEFAPLCETHRPGQKKEASCSCHGQLCGVCLEQLEERLSSGVLLTPFCGGWVGSCDAESCLCPNGNQYDEDDTVWEIILCSYCGAQGIHVKCGKLRLLKPRWKCSFCKEVVGHMPRQVHKVSE